MGTTGGTTSYGVGVAERALRFRSGLLECGTYPDRSAWHRVRGQPTRIALWVSPTRHEPECGHFALAARLTGRP